MNRLFGWLFKKRPLESRGVANRVILPDEELRSEIGVPPTRERLAFSVTRCDHDGDWDYRIYLTEGAEFYFGSEVFSTLEEKFREIVGVAGVRHLDREVFLVRSAMSQAQLQDCLWEEILRAAEGVSAPKSDA
jgi:hypothetical protein